MSKCPNCGKSLNDWHILTLGKTNSITCTSCGKKLKAREAVSGVKIVVGTGFLAGGLAGGICAVTGHLLHWFVFVILWFLFLCLVDVRYTRLDVKKETAS